MKCIGNVPDDVANKHLKQRSESAKQNSKLAKALNMDSDKVND